MMTQLHPDIALIFAMEELCNEIQTPEECEVLRRLLPILRSFRDDFQDFEPPTVNNEVV